MPNDIKPLSLRRRECLQQCVQAVNQAQLPAFTMVDLLEGLLREAKALADQEYQRDLESWQAAQQNDSEPKEA